MFVQQERERERGGVGWGKGEAGGLGKKMIAYFSAHAGNDTRKKSEIQAQLFSLGPSPWEFVVAWRMPYSAHTHTRTHAAFNCHTHSHSHSDTPAESHWHTRKHK